MGNAGGGLIGEECGSARWHVSLANGAILDHVSTCKLQRSLEMGNFGTNNAARGGSGGKMAGRVIGEGCGRSVGGMSLKRAKQARKSF